MAACGWSDWEQMGVCYAAHGAGMVERALIECAEKGVLRDNGRIVSLVPSEEEQTWVLCTSHSPKHCCYSASSHPPASCTKTLLLSVCQSQLFHSNTGSTCSGMPSWGKNVLEWVRQTGPAHESALPALTLIRKMCVCELDPALYELWWTPPCNKFNVTAGTGCNATITLAPSPIRAEPCVKGHYITLPFRPCSCGTLGLCELECQGVGS